jgi:hypothetical protein
MRNSKLITVIIILFVFTVTGLNIAQDNSQTGEKKKYKHTPEEQAKIITDKMKSHLNLTDEQYGKILKLQTDNITYKRDLREKDLISKSEIKQKREAFRSGINNTLTADQMKKMDKMMKHHHHKHREHYW